MECRNSQAGSLDEGECELEVFYRPISERDLKNIVSYIALDLASPRAARGVFEEIRSAVDAIRANPEIGRLMNDERLDKRWYRRFAVKNYWVIYRVDEEQKCILVERILHQRQDLSPRIYYEINMEDGSIL